MKSKSENRTQICPLCKKGVLSNHIRSHVDSGIEYDLFECTSCHAQYWDPLKNPGSIWYELDVRYAHRNEDPILDANEKHVGTIDFFNKKFPGKQLSVFDIGCGVGNFLAYAAKFNHDVTGIDFDRDGIEAGKRAFGLEKLTVDDLSSYKEKHKDQKFDLVTFFDVFEHIDDHNIFIDDVYSYVKEGGHISLSVPFRYGAHWLMPHDLPPRHLTRWDISSLSLFLSRHKFSVVYAKRLPATIPFIVIKLRFRYGKLFNFGLVSKFKRKESVDVYQNEHNKTVVISKRTLKIKIVHTLAKAKDYILFGIPATIIFLVLLFTRKRYTDMYVIAQKQ